MDKLKTLNKFSDIYAITKDMSRKEKGDLFEKFTYHLFELDPMRNNALQNIWLYEDIPDKIIKKLNLPSKDRGIDLLALINFEYYAIQCKFRQNPEVCIPWGELGTFFGLSFGINDGIKGGFFVTNTHNLCPEVIKSEKVVPIYSDYFDSLPKQFFQSIGEKKKKRYIKKIPFDYQEKCINIVSDHYIKNRRGYIEMACGTGKSLTAYWVMKNMCNTIGVIFVPSLQLLSQFASDFIVQAYSEKEVIDYILVGSKSDIDDDVQYKTNGLVLHTDPEKIHDYIIGTANKTIIICTYQSSDKLAEAIPEFSVDFAIFDEAHRTVGQKNKQFTMMLNNKHLKIKKRLFMTATPKFYKGENDDIASMDDEKIYGKCIFSYNTGRAIAEGRLTDYKLLSIYADSKSISQDIKKNKLVSHKNEFTDKDANYVGSALVLLKKFHDGTINHLVTYHNTVNRANKFAELLYDINELLGYDDIYINCITGSDSMGKRRKIINEFVGGEKSILCSARVLNEGINIPIIDSICFVDARESTGDIIQCIGRCLRLYNGKNIAYVIIPIFIDNFEDDFDKNIFGSIIRVVKSSKNTDTGLVEFFILKSSGKTRGKNRGTIRDVMINENYSMVNISKKIDINKWYDNIDACIWKISDKWISIYTDVIKWIEINKRIPSSKSKDPIEQILGAWCNTQRKNKKIGMLLDDRLEQLNKIEGWYWKKNLNEKWDCKLIELNKWVEINKKMPSEHSKNLIEKSLGMWCSRQRKSKKNNKLSNSKIKKLNDIKEWYWSLIGVWLEKYIAFKKWVKINKRIPSRAYSKRNKEKNLMEIMLAGWCEYQRSSYRKGTLSNFKIKKMNQIIGWFGNNRRKTIKSGSKKN